MQNLTVVESVVTEAEVGCSVKRHPNVAFTKMNGTYTFENKQVEITAACKLQSFETYLNNVKDKKTLQIILLQIAHAVHHIHEQELCHGGIEMKKLLISECKKKVVLVAADIKKKTAESQSQDILRLKKLFEDILDAKGLYDNISEDLCMQMKKSSFTSENVLQHPYFWSTAVKLRFLAITAQRIKEDKKTEETKKNDPMPQKTNKIETDGTYLEIKLSRSHGVFSAREGWFAKLALVDKEELEGYNEHFREKQSGKNKTEQNETEQKTGRTAERKLMREVRPDSIVKLAFEWNYSTEHLWSLVKFIRDQLEHYWEKSLQVQACFLFDPLEGYWEFFNKRYPGLLPVVYNVVMDAQEQYGDKDIYDVYFTTTALNEDLPVA